MIIQDKELYLPWVNSPKLPENFAVADANYFCPKPDLVYNEIYPKYWQWMQSLKWTKWMHKWDCDNFADAFKLFACGYYEQNIDSEAEGMGVGVVWFNAKDGEQNSYGHAINIIYIHNEKNNGFYHIFLEPQNGKELILSKKEFDSIWLVYI